MTDVIIIGAGTAGLSAAVYACRAGKSVLVLEKELVGGQIVYSHRVENYPGIKEISGMEFANGLFEQATDLGAEVQLEDVSKIINCGDKKIVVTDDGQHECKSVIIASGVKSKKLGVDGENEFIGKGVSYCAVCDGAFYKNKDVAVVGGGNTALQDALLLCAYCKKVYLIHRRNSFRGEQKLVDTLRKKENVVFVLDSVVKKIGGGESVSFAEIENVNSKEKSTVSLSGVFVAVGQKPDNEAFKSVVELSEDGFIVAGEDCRTKTNGIFAAGDCRTKSVRQLTTAAADGAVAALAACEFAE